MIDSLNHLTRLTAIISAPPTSLNDLRYITQQVEHFYGEGWNTVLWEVGLITTALGVVFPVLVNLIERQTLMRRIANAEKRLRAIEENFRRETNKIKDDLQRFANYAKADGLTVNANALSQAEALTKLLTAAEYYVKGGGYQDAVNRLNEISDDEFTSRLQHEHKSDIRNIVPSIKRLIERVRSEAQSVSSDEPMKRELLGAIQKTEEKYNQILQALTEQNQEGDSV